MADVLTVRPTKVRRVCWVLAPLVVVCFILLGALLSGSIGPGQGTFQASDQVAMGLLGALGAAGVLLFTRPKVTADTEHIVIQNVIGGYDLPWAVVSAIRFDRGASWASLDLADGDVVALMAIQATDKSRAVESIRALRALHATYVAEHSQPQP
jgi:hypothetical protein